ncbi:hypothetical protein ACUN9Y_13225 [Halomonas sp. V046]|uniref:hypothetical protein n=1 Tax=Halomonas sp. V046 TaxID=3459611 RepID=UPI004044E5A4
MTDQRLTPEDVANLDMPPVSATYQRRTTSTAKRLADMVEERGISRGTLGLRMARRVDSQARLGQTMMIAGADFTVVP